MADYTRDTCNKLKKHGWKFERHGKGDHNLWKSADGKNTVAVDGEIKSRHSANEILKRAGIKELFR